MNRRNFISLTTVTAAAVSVPFLNCSSKPTTLQKNLALPQTLAQITDQKTLYAIGKAFGAVNSNEYSVSKLEQQLIKNEGVQTISSATSAKNLYTILNNNIQHDFETANTIILKGWVLSITEARQCALFSLIHKN